MKKNEQFERLLLQIAELQGNIGKLRTETQERLEGLENRIQNRIQGFENQVRDWRRPDPHLWALETFTIVTSNICIALLVGSIPTRGFERMAYGALTIFFGVFFLQTRLVVGRHIQVPQRFFSWNASLSRSDNNHRDYNNDSGFIAVFRIADVLATSGDHN